MTFLITALILRASRRRDLEAEGDSFGAAIAQTESEQEGKKSEHLSNLAASAATTDSADTTTAVATTPIQSIVFACDAGMGSSAMGASVLRNKLKKAGITDITVTNQAIANLDGSADLVITQQQLTDRARDKSPELRARLGRQLHECAAV